LKADQSPIPSRKTAAHSVAKCTHGAKLELNCPTTTAQVLSKEMIQSEIMNPRWAPPQRAQYTVGVSGCDKRATYLVVCAEGGTGCVAAGAQNVIQTSSAK